MKQHLVTLTILFLFLTSPATVLAQQGCCSWHGGVNYCAANGRYVCGDGTYSPTCTCATYNAPRQLIITAPKVNASKLFLPNQYNRKFTVAVEWDETTAEGYSVNLSKVPGGDPGPLVDVTEPRIIFKDIEPGTWYLNLKMKFSGRWSNVQYWTVVVPEWYPPATSTPSPTPQPKSKSFVSSLFKWFTN